MVITYLEKLLAEYQQEKEEVDKQISEQEISLKENIEFVKLLEETNDNSYECFTPRNVNSRNKQKVLQLKDEQKQIMEQLDTLKLQSAEWVHKIDELKSVIRFQKMSEDVTAQTVESIDSDKGMRMALLEVQENERQRISRELHDSTVQNLTSLVHKTELCSKLIDTDAIRCKLELTTVNHILREVIQNTREMIYDLHPMSFDDIGLDVTIQDAIQKIGKANSIHVQYAVEGEEVSVSSVIGISILRIIQEACSNAIKHGHAQMISVTMKYEPAAISLTIEDDGCGFEKEDIPDKIRENHSGFGISMMRERIYLLSGTLEIDSKVNEGTKVLVSIPLEEREEN